ncbi:LapA family protein [Mycobacterium sp. 852002-51163_SCH5372311]|uniref:LapA family protein n=1 Tax=Mycobacterium sp. 852002-51163_SCH5372311 TaxID=1834097 RepID=UPI000A7A7CC8
MGDISRGLGDPARPTRTRGAHRNDEPIDDVERIPRMVVVGAAVIVFVVGIANFALGQVGLGVAAVSIGLLVFGAGLSWLAMERRRIREAEREWPPY